jgi:predicted Zn-dependent protease
MPKPIGRPYPVKGADELFGELLLQAGRPVEAIAWFERTLGRTPNRSRAVLGLARAAARAGDAAKRRTAYEQFLRNWRHADPDLPELAEARKAVGG